MAEIREKDPVYAWWKHYDKTYTVIERGRAENTYLYMYIYRNHAITSQHILLYHIIRSVLGKECDFV